MGIDDNPVDALRKYFELEDSSTSSVGQRVLNALSSAPLPWPLSAAIGRLKDRMVGDSNHRIKVMLETIADELVEQDKQIQELRAKLDPPALESRSEALTGLLIDGARKASVTRSIERVKRIGVILANGIIEPRTPDEDEIEDMMRIATELTDQDVAYLREIVRIHGEIVKRDGRIERYNAYTQWEHGFWGTQISGEIDSVFSKLESYGLVFRIPPPNNLNIGADFQNRYALLSKGMRFVQLIKEKA
jgi:hypothetical protein